eukprot:3487463-Heterocapsa_arctica.AAC.1
MTKVLCTNKSGHRTKQCWSLLLKLKIGLKLRCCAKVSAFCEESNGDSEDARRPFKQTQKPSKTVQKPSVVGRQ